MPIKYHDDLMMIFAMPRVCHGKFSKKSFNKYIP